MFNYNCKITFIVLLIFPLMSFGQTVVINEISLQSNIITKNRIGFSAWPTGISYDNILADRLFPERDAGIEPPEIDTEPLNNIEKSFPKNIVSLKMGADDPWFGISYERLFSQYIGTEVQIGLIGASLGAKLYFPATRSGRVNFHVGALPGWGFMGGLKTYFPIGVNLLTKNNFRISLDAGPRIWHGEDEENFLGFSLKLGKGF